MGVYQEKIAVKHPQFVYTYQATDLAATTTGTLVGQQTDVTARTMISRGSVFALSVAMSGTLTSGTLTLTPAINGTLQSSTLELERNTAGDRYFYKAINGRAVNFVAGDRLEVHYETASLSPTTLDIVCDVYTLLENVEL